jgi:hypothetical protein
MIEPPKRLLTRSQASNYRPSLARSMSNIGLGRMDDIEENDVNDNDDDDELTTEPITSLSSSSSLCSSSPSSMNILTSTFAQLQTEKNMKLYAHALSDIL